MLKGLGKLENTWKCVRALNSALRLHANTTEDLVAQVQSGVAHAKLMRFRMQCARRVPEFAHAI